MKEKFGGKSLIPDYTFLRKIWTHPKVLENAWKNAIVSELKVFFGFRYFTPVFCFQFSFIFIFSKI